MPPLIGGALPHGWAEQQAGGEKYIQVERTVSLCLAFLCRGRIVENCAEINLCRCQDPAH